MQWMSLASHTQGSARGLQDYQGKNNNEFCEEAEEEGRSRGHSCM